MSLEKEINQSKFKSLYEKNVVNILFTAKTIETKMKEFLSEFGITGSQYNILRILNGAFPNALSPGAIKEVMLEKGTDLTRLLDRMEKKQIVSRILCPSNRRKMDIKITKEGKYILDQMQPKLQNAFKAISKNVSKNDSIIVNDSLDKIRSHFS